MEQSKRGEKQMKNRIKAILLACSLSAGMFAVPSYAADSAKPETATEAELSEEAEAAQDIEAATEEAAATGETEAAASLEDQLATVLDQTLSELSAMTDDELNYYIDNGNDSTKKMMASWRDVKEELGVYQGIESKSFSTEGNTYTIHAKVNYDQLSDNTDAYVDFVYDVKNQTMDLSWNVDYPMSYLMAQAGMNTLMGLGIVFLVLIFLAFVISRFKLIGGRKDKKKTEAEAVEAAAAPETAAEEEEDLTNDEELVAVITAAVAASEGTSTNGFVVRSIKKANRKNWQNA